MQNLSESSLAIYSDTSRDLERPEKDPGSFEWWYFDALSDDGKEAVVITYFENLVFSPRFADGANRQQEIIIPDTTVAPTKRIPAVSFLYYRNGRPIYRLLHEYGPEDFAFDTNNGGCHIGNSGFRSDSAPYGSGFTLSIDLPLARGRRLTAELEWLSIESNFDRRNQNGVVHAHEWNVAVPRADVTGRITLFGRRGTARDIRHFRGTGYHDHDLDNRWMSEMLDCRYRGRAHFPDCTSIFSIYQEIGDATRHADLFAVQDNEMIRREVVAVDQKYGRNRFGVKYPRRLRMTASDGTRVNVSPKRIIDSGFYYLRFLCEVTVAPAGGAVRSSLGLSEYTAPKALKHRWLGWIEDLRVRKTPIPR